MKLLIDIPEESYKAACNGCMLPPDVENVVNAIKNGRRLIDVDAILKSVELKCFLEQDGMHLVTTIDGVKEALNDAQTIVEAERVYLDKDAGERV